MSTSTSADSRSHKGGFAGRGAFDIVDAQLHISPALTPDAALAAMDALGIRSVLLEELWSIDAGQYPRPCVAYAGGYRPISPLAQAASIQYPDRFAYIQRVRPEDPLLDVWIAMLAQFPACRALRVALLDAKDRGLFADGGYDRVMQLAIEHDLPLCIMSSDQAAPLIDAAASRLPALKIVIDHCGWPRSIADWEATLRLAERPNAWLKWSHVRRGFRRFGPLQETMQREFLRAVERFGAARVLWAGDVSHEESSASWSEMLAFVRDNAALSDADKASILGGTARRLFGWDKGV